MSTIEIDEATLHRLHGLAAVGELSAGTAHELRNLVTAILGFTQLAAEGDAARCIQLVEREAARCLQLLEHQLDLVRQPTERELVDITNVVEHVASSAGPQVALQRVALRVSVPALPRVSAIRGELQHVLLNLVINALDATPDGGEITITGARAGDMVEVAVSDSGTGVPAELRNTIFTPFFTTKGERGVGLGLSLCRTIVQRHGGTVELDATRTPGARFVMRIPVAPC
jgi:signal transduction histidine kinase